MKYKDINRIGFKPQKGNLQYSRMCQNSADVKRKPLMINSVDELIKKGYKYNDKTKLYEKSYKDGKLTAYSANDHNNQFYICDPSENKKYTYIGFL